MALEVSWWVLGLVLLVAGPMAVALWARRQHSERENKTRSFVGPTSQDVADDLRKETVAMARLFGFIANRPDLGVRVLSQQSTAFEIASNAGPLAWGVGFYQGGEVLLRRRPLDERPKLTLAELVKDVRTDVLLGHVRKATVGSLRTENTHPFRFRQWLFAHTGTIAAYSSISPRLIESLPEFLRKNIRGDTDSEVLFHLFLSFLHDAGKLVADPIDPGAIRDALRSSLAVIDRLSAEEGAKNNTSNVLITNGDSMVALHAAGTMTYRVYDGRHEIEGLFSDDDLRRLRLPDSGALRVSVVTADGATAPEGFVPVTDRAMLTLTRTAAPHLEAL